MDRFYDALPLSQKMAVCGVAALARLGLSRPLQQIVLSKLGQDIARAKRTAFRGYVPTASDILVCSHVKSGTNWSLQIVQQALERGAADFAHIHDVVPWPDRPMPNLPLTLRSPVTSASGLRVIKTHSNQGDTPYAPEAKYIVVIRDPKDVFVSSYHFARGVLAGLIAPSFTPEQWLEWTLNDRAPMGCWARHTSSWWAIRDRPNVHWTLFRRLKADLRAEVQAIGDFIGMSLTPAEHAAVVQRSGFEWMKSNNHRFRPPMPLVRDVAPVQMIRTGEVGQRGLISDAQFAQIDAYFIERLAQLGSDFPYAELFAEA